MALFPLAWTASPSPADARERRRRRRPRHAAVPARGATARRGAPRLALLATAVITILMLSRPQCRRSRHRPTARTSSPRASPAPACSRSPARDPARPAAARERGAGAPARHRPRQPERAERVHRPAPAREHPRGGRVGPHPAHQRDGRAPARQQPGSRGRAARRGRPRLLYLLEAWRRQEHDRRDSTGGRLRGRRHGDPAALRVAVGARGRARADLPRGHERRRARHPAVEARRARAAERAASPTRSATPWAR